MKADVVIITALPMELDSVLTLGEKFYELTWKKVTSPRSSRTYYKTKNKLGTRIVVVRTSGMGQLKSAALTGDILYDCFPKIILLVGIAAGIGDAVKLGDIVISKRFIDYELGKLTDQGQKHDFPTYKSSPSLVEALSDFHNKEWVSNLLRARPDEADTRLTKVHSGDIFCGNKVIADSHNASDLKSTFRGGIALEMESVGIAALLEDRKSPPHFAMIKGVCDKADSNKDDKWQQFASDIAATYALAFLQSIDLNQFTIEFAIASIEEQISTILNVMAPDLKDIEDFQKHLIEKVLQSSLKEASKILNGQYMAHIDYGSHFLLRAVPLFGYASKIYATSLDSISTFWTDTSNRAEALEYMANQAPQGTAMRLFVFSSADSAHKYAEMLDYHANSYKNVFICSKTSYLKILKEIAVGVPAEELNDFDFSILQYQSTNSYQTNLYANLSSNHLSYEIIDIDKPDKINYKRFIELLERFSTLKKGKSDKEYEVLSWQNGMWHNREKWGSILLNMFNERNADVFHSVTFYVEQDIEELLRKECANVKRAIMNSEPNDENALRVKYGIKDVWFGKQIVYNHNIFDGEYGGSLTINSTKHDPYILLMQFDNAEGLQRFYNDTEHSSIRKRIYETLDNRIQQIYKLADSEPFINGNPQRRKLIYEAIESMASNYMKRRDYINDELIREMVMTTEPYQF